MPPTDTLPGSRLGEYIIEKVVAAGGMGIVYQAVHPLLGNKVAVKVLRPEYARNGEQVERFLKEARVISSIRHRGIIHIQGFGDLPDGRQYMVMEFLEGETLEKEMERDAPLLPNRALPIVDEVLDALSAAHQVGVVHRDLKPSNVFLTLQSNGTRYCTLLDFGLARQGAFSGDELPVVAKASMIAGTPEYVSPEQVRGLVPTARADLYGVGVMLFEMLTGRLPFQGTTLKELLRKHLHEKPPRVSQFVRVPEALDDLVASMLQKDPELRPRSADVTRQAIARIMKELKEASTRQVSVSTALRTAVEADKEVVTAAGDSTGTSPALPFVPDPDGNLPSPGRSLAWPIAGVVAAVVVLGLLWRASTSEEPVVMVAKPAPVPVAPVPIPVAAPIATVVPRPVEAPPEALRKGCEAGWKPKARAQLDKLSAQKKKRINSGGFGPGGAMDALRKMTEEEAQLVKEIEGAKTPEQCGEALDHLEGWTRASVSTSR